MQVKEPMKKKKGWSWTLPDVKSCLRRRVRGSWRALSSTASPCPAWRWGASCSGRSAPPSCWISAVLFHTHRLSPWPWNVCFCSALLTQPCSDPPAKRERETVVSNVTFTYWYTVLSILNNFNLFIFQLGISRGKVRLLLTMQCQGVWFSKWLIDHQRLEIH